MRHQLRHLRARHSPMAAGPSLEIIFISIVSAILALFVSLNSFLVIDPVRAHSVLRSAAQALPVRNALSTKKAPATSVSPHPAATGGTGEPIILGVLAEEILRLAPQGKIETVRNGFRLTLPTGELFDGESARLKATARPVLELISRSTSKANLSLRGEIYTLAHGRSAEELLNLSFPLALSRSSSLYRYLLDSEVRKERLTVFAALSQPSAVRLPDSTVIELSQEAR